MENKKNPKADIGRNSSLYFALGLALMMFLSYGTINYKVYDKSGWLFLLFVYLDYQIS